MSIRNIFGFSYPIVIGEEKKEGHVLNVIINKVMGTTFSIGNGFFLTAAHVIEQCGDSNIWIGRTDKNPIEGIKVDDIEMFPNSDIAIIKCLGLKSAIPTPWTNTLQARLSDVFTSGYPFAFETETLTIHGRAFKGHVVGISNFHRLKDNPDVYELSFACPRGLSGSPLVEWGERPLICGLVIGNQSTEMNLITEREITDEGEKIVYERYESMNLGVAVSNRTILGLKSKLLGSTFSEYLNNSGLL